jgi:hypothetical protein
MTASSRPAPRTWPDRILFAGAALLLGIGWLERDDTWINAENGIGYALGIAGGSMMLGLLLYPLRKKARWMSGFGPVPAWFRTHMWLGVLGPVAVLYHANFQLGSLNSNVALFAMTTVALSGLVGRYFYTKVHRSLYATRLSLAELRGELSASRTGLAEVFARLPSLDQALHTMEEQALISTVGIGPAWVRAARLRYQGGCILLALRKSLRQATGETPDFSAARDFVRGHLRIVYRIADFALYDRLLSLWHLLHLPLFFLLLVAGSVHVLAVHMY